MENLEFTFKSAEKLLKAKINDFSQNIYFSINDGYKYKIVEISWEYLTNKVSIKNYKNELNIKYACQSQDGKKMLVIYEDVYNKSTLLLIFDEMGKILNQITPPSLISSTSKLFNIHKNVYFNTIYWNNKIEKKIHVDISFNEDYYEIRLFDLESIEFNDCIQSGRL